LLNLIGTWRICAKDRAATRHQSLLEYCSGLMPPIERKSV
jgi:hypothetical protein